MTETGVAVAAARARVLAVMRARPEAWSDDGRQDELDLYELAVRADEVFELLTRAAAAPKDRERLRLRDPWPGGAAGLALLGRAVTRYTPAAVVHAAHALRAAWLAGEDLVEPLRELERAIRNHPPAPPVEEKGSSNGGRDRIDSGGVRDGEADPGPADA